MFIEFQLLYIGPPCLFIQGVTEVIIRDIAGVLKNHRMGFNDNNH